LDGVKGEPDLRPIVGSKVDSCGSPIIKNGFLNSSLDMKSIEFEGGANFNFPVGDFFWLLLYE